MTEDEKSALTALTRLLQDEITAIRAGDLDRVLAHAPAKAELVATLEAANPALDAALRAEPADMALRRRIARLQDLIAQDAMLLDSLVQASGGMIAEIARIRDRHGLRGVYGENGTQRPAEPLSPARFDRSV